MADDLTKLRERLALAHKEVGEIAAQGAHRRWRMSIPAQPDRDSDLLISRALADADKLAAAVERVRALCREVHHGGAADMAGDVLAILDHPTDTDKEPEEDDQWRRDEREMDGGFSGCELPRLWPPRRRHPTDTTGEDPYDGEDPAVVAACIGCPGCLTGGRCIDDQDEDDGWDDHPTDTTGEST